MSDEFTGVQFDGNMFGEFEQFAYKTRIEELEIERDALRARLDDMSIQLEAERESHRSWKAGAGEWIIKCNILGMKLDEAKEAFRKIPREVDKLRNTWEIPDQAFATFGAIVGIALEAAKKLEG